MIFKIAESDYGITIRDVDYYFDHVNSFKVENPEKTKLVRGANAGNNTGIVYKEGVKDAKTVTMTVIGIEKDLHNLLKEVYAAQERVSVWGIMKADGSSKIAKNAVLSQEPMQLSMDDSSESLNTDLIFESYDVSENHKA